MYSLEMIEMGLMRRKAVMLLALWGSGISEVAMQLYFTHTYDSHMKIHDYSVVILSVLINILCIYNVHTT